MGEKKEAALGVILIGLCQGRHRKGRSNSEACRGIRISPRYSIVVVGR